jgi:phosphomannomutase
MNRTIFREYDIRGIVATDLTDEVVKALGCSFGTLLRKKGYSSVACGYDLRLSSAHLQSVFLEGLLSTGCWAIDVGQVPTPALYFSTLHFDTDAGVMITGSHNPIEFNGIKMLDRQGSIYGQQIQSLLRIIDEGSYAVAQPGELRCRAILPEYIRMLKSKFNFKRSLKIVIDAGNATAAQLRLLCGAIWGWRWCRSTVSQMDPFPIICPIRLFPSTCEICRRGLSRKRPIWGWDMTAMPTGWVRWMRMAG